MNLALGALAAVLTAAILAVLFVDDGEPTSAPQETSTTAPSQPPISAPASTSPTTDGSDPQPQVPQRWDGRWRSADGETVVRFSGTTIESIRSVIDLEGESATLLSTEPAQLSSQPTTNQRVQAVAFVTVETEIRRIGPEPILAEFVAIENGLSLKFEIAGAEREFTLLPN